MDDSIPDLSVFERFRPSNKNTCLIAVKAASQTQKLFLILMNRNWKKATTYLSS